MNTQDEALNALLAAGIDPDDVPSTELMAAQDKPEAKREIADRAGRTVGQRIEDIGFVTELWLAGVREKDILDKINAARPYKLDMPLLRRDLRYVEEMLAARLTTNIMAAQAREHERNIKLFGEIWRDWELSATQPTLDETIVYEIGEDGAEHPVRRTIRRIVRSGRDPKLAAELNKTAQNIARLNDLGGGRGATTAWEDQIIDGLRQGKISPTAVIDAFPDAWASLLRRAGIQISPEIAPKVIDEE